jgi:hypothetical protein
MEVEIAEARRMGSFPEPATDVHPAVGPISEIGKDPLARVALELSLKQLPRRLAQHDGTGASLGPWEPDHPLIEIDLLAPKAPDLAQAHERQPRQLRNLPEGWGHRLENENLLFRAKPAHTRFVLGKERPGGEARLGSHLLGIAPKLRRSSLERFQLLFNAQNFRSVPKGDAKDPTR